MLLKAAFVSSIKAMMNALKGTPWDAFSATSGADDIESFRKWKMSKAALSDYESLEYLACVRRREPATWRAIYEALKVSSEMRRAPGASAPDSGDMGCLGRFRRGLGRLECLGRFKRGLGRLGRFKRGLGGHWAINTKVSYIIEEIARFRRRQRGFEGDGEVRMRARWRVLWIRWNAPKFYVRNANKSLAGAIGILTEIGNCGPQRVAVRVAVLRQSLR